MVTLGMKHKTRRKPSCRVLGSAVIAVLCGSLLSVHSLFAQRFQGQKAGEITQTITFSAAPATDDRAPRNLAFPEARHLALRPISLLLPGIAALVGSGPRRITLEEAQQQAAQAGNPMARLGQLSVEAAKQHRLGAQADYFPKLSSTLANVHFNKFMGEQFTVNRPIAGGTTTIQVPLVGKNQTLIAVTATQPITPLLKIRELVHLARADENIARAKAGMSVAETANAVERNYYDLLIAQRQLALAELNLGKPRSKHMVSSSTLVALNLEQAESETIEANKARIETSSRVKELTVSLNELLGWPENTDLELVQPPPLVENISMKEAVDKAAAANPEVIEAEQNVAKARAGSKLSKLDYIPDVAVLGGYMYQNNALPPLPRDFSFIGILASYNLFDFGKREHTIKERNAQVEMAETALELTKGKVTAGVKMSYFELERTRQLSEMAHRMESAAHTMDVKYGRDDPEMSVSRGRIELETLQVDFDHRKAYAKLMGLIGER